MPENNNNKRKLELVTAMPREGLGYWWKNGDDPNAPWHGPIHFG